jgi:hypothetical protein
MRQLAKQLAFALGTVSPFYEVALLLSKVSNHPKIELRLKKIRAERRFSSLIGVPCPVQSGPFKGLIYPFKSAFYSSFSPKILGCYEEELHGELENLLEQDYDLAIDIGSAEGFYAAGILFKKRELRLLAFDIDETARSMTRKIAEVNQLSDRLSIHEGCSPTDLKKIKPNEKVLIVCDCEGFENELFTVETIAHLASSSLLIELHDQYVPGTTKRLSDIFSLSHRLVLIESKNRGESHPLLKQLGFSNSEMGLLLSEERDGIMGSKPMNWLIATPKSK